MLVFEKQVADNPTYYYRSTATNENDFNQDVVEIWIEALKRIRENREDGTWDRLLFECWCFDGFVLAYPQKRGESPDKRKPSIVISMDILNETKLKLEETEDDNAVRNLIALAYIKVRRPIRTVYRREPALSEIKKTLEKNDFTCWTMKNADTDSLMKFDVFFR